MDKVAGIGFLVLTAPLWVVGLALSPVYLVERVSYRLCRAALIRFLVAFRGKVKLDPLSSRERYFAKARNARKAHKAVRP